LSLLKKSQIDDRSEKAIDILHFAFDQLLNWNWLLRRKIREGLMRRHEKWVWEERYPVYFLRLEDVLHDLEIGDELVFVLCVHLDTIHWYVA
jgi:hypothetical protein